MAFVRLGKGKQGDIIKMVQSHLPKDELGRLERQAINSGICFMLSMEWLIAIIDEGPTNRLMAFNEPEEVQRNPHFYQSIANNFFCYISNASYINAMNRAEREARKTGVRMTPGELEQWIKKNYPMVRDELVVQDVRCGRCRTLPQINALMTDLCSRGRLNGDVTYLNPDEAGVAADYNAHHPRHFLLGFIAQYNDGKSGGHKMACSVLADGKILFYDPNIGVCRADRIHDVLQYIKAGYLADAVSCEFDLCVVR